MPVALLAVPAAIALAWIALKGRLPNVRALAGAGGPLEAGYTGDLAPDVNGTPGEEEEPFKRRELRSRRRGGGQDDPETYGGEVGGPYGPATGEGGSSGGYAELPGPTQTYTLAGGGYARSIMQGARTEAVDVGSLGLTATPTRTTTVDTSSLVGSTGGSSSVVRVPTSLVLAPAPAPAPSGGFVAS